MSVTTYDLSGPVPRKKLRNILGAELSLFDAAEYGAKGDGVNDDAPAIQAAIADAQNAAYGSDVFLRPGIYSTSQPLLITDSGPRLIGAGPGATGGGGGTGSGSFTPGTGGTISGVLFTGAVIAPNYNGNGWSSTGFNENCTILVDSDANGGSAIYRVTVENLTLYGGGLGGSVSSHGIVFRGNVDAGKVKNCVICVYYGVNSNGIFLDVDNAAAHSPDGQWMQDCMIQFVGNNGIQGAFGDGEITRCHTQSIGGYGYWISDGNTGIGQGGNIRISDCRADLGGNDGFYFYLGCGAIEGMICVSNCTTQSNTQNGFHVHNIASNETCPVYFSNCVAQGDARDGSSAGWRFSGPVWASLASCATHISHTGTPDNFPYLGVTTTQSGTGQSARFISIHGGSFAAKTTAFNTVNAPLVQAVDTFTSATGTTQFGTGTTFTHVTTL